ncbi:MAG: RHS repeat domain-containing protein [Bacteroidia bacterium]
MYKKNTDELYYFHLDVMGSLVAITDESGILLESRNYDPWGKPRNPQTLSYTLSNPFGESSSSYTLRGYTFHEHYEMFDLINMNGRLYDNQIGQFINADPILADNENLQNYNRYSYVMNNPLKYTDPSGYVPKGGGGPGTYGSESQLQSVEILSKQTADSEKGFHERQENMKNETLAFLLSSGAGPINPDVLGYILPEFSTAPTKAKQSGTNFSWAQSLQQAGNYSPYYQMAGGNGNIGGNWYDYKIVDKGNNTNTTIGISTGLVGGMWGYSSANTYTYAQKFGNLTVSAGQLTKLNAINAIKVANFLGRVNFVTGAIGSTYSLGRYFTSGKDARTKDLVDGIVGVGGTVIGGAALLGIVSNPVGWGIGIGVSIYFGARFIYDLNNP